MPPSRMSREIEADILLERSGRSRDWFVRNPKDPPKSLCTGKHIQKGKTACSVCGTTRFVSMYWDQATGAVLCGRCALPAGTGAREQVQSA